MFLLIEKIKEKLNKINDLQVKYKISIKKYTSFKVGGPVDILAIPSSTNALRKLLNIIKEYDLPTFVLGKGSNIIVGDKGYRGIVIYTGELKKVSFQGNTLTAESGITLASLANKALAQGLTGLEFASGIPGTLGGALFMNAGAYGGEMKDVVTSAELIDYSSEEIKLEKKDLKLSYRYSVIQEKPMIITRVHLLLKPGEKRKIREKMQALNRKRKEKQPLEWPSAGSIFKRPTGYYSGPLIEGAGLKGLRVGDAQVSKKHAGFIINIGNATASDIKNLISKVQDEVFKKHGVNLEVEPRFIGEFE
ncbi:MAG: UDP-N-acetylmuramate dehydrogenase [Bacillota bacterium]